LGEGRDTAVGGGQPSSEPAEQSGSGHRRNAVGNVQSTGSVKSMTKQAGATSASLLCQFLRPKGGNRLSSFSVLAGGHAEKFFELLGKMGETGVSCFNGDLID